MKSFRDYLQEAERKKDDEEGEHKPKPTKDKENDWDSLDHLFGPQDDNPLTNPNEPERAAEPEHDQEPDRPEMNRASQRDTQRAAGNINNPRMHDLLSRMRNIENDPDDPGYPEPENPDVPAIRVDNQNLPRVAGQALDAAGVQRPDFHQVANLPGNMNRAIRTLGKHLFRSMTRTPTDDIWMVANLGGQGPNTPAEVNAVANWVREHGDDLGDGNIDFDTTIPGYNADIKQYSAAGIRWLLVRDEFGNYIYSWPEHDSTDPHNTRELDHRPNRPRLGHNR
jgi:hypothetical protein